ncbi:MAG: toll/interleukin-1 receptor domain-containing protein, partial [Bacteroidales bacterium]|nr:toll/interleukin-1 receptor domain-containing protein [Bacteroidales bacterium]
MASWRNYEHPVFISYSWSNDGNPDIEDDVIRLCELMEEKGIFYLLDKGKGEHQLLGYPNSIPEAEKVIGRGDMIIIVFSKKYLLSPNCWYEWYRISESDNFGDRVVPIILSDTPRLIDINEQLTAMEHKVADLKSVKRSKTRTLSTAEEYFIEFVNNGEYENALEKMAKYFSDTIIPNYEDLVVDDYKTVIDTIYKKASKYFDKPLKYSDWGKNLFERPDDTKELLDVVNNNKFVNLVAMGGSGKTSLVKLFMAEYETSFDRIEYSLINNKLSSDIFSNNSTLKEFFDNDKLLKEIKDNEDKFANAINVLQNCETTNNLWIIDINETSDYKEIENIIDAWISQSNQIVSPWKNWRFLFVGRKCFHNIETNLFVPYDLKNTHDVLSGIFFNYLGNRTVNYQQRVSDGKINLDELFSGLFDLPILVEHTARFLSKWPVVCETTDAIFKIIDPKGGNKRASVKFLKELKAQGSAFWNKNQDFTKAPQYKNVADFLTYLLFFDDLKEEQKYVCRHFMLWPAEPLTLKEIHRMIGDDEDYSEFKLGLCLVGLEEERIIVGDNKDGEKAYKMHALTADAFRVQVLKEKKVDERYRDYSQYFANIAKMEKTSSEIQNCLSFCFAQTEKTSETYLPAEFFDNDEGFFNADFYKKLAVLTGKTPLSEKWYKLKLIEEVCGIEDHTQKLNKYQEYKDKSSHKVYEENYTPSQGNEIDQDLKTEVLSQMVELK